MTDTDDEPDSDLRELYLETAGEKELVESQNEDDDRLDEDGVDLDGAIDSGLDEAIEGTESSSSGGAGGE